MGGMTAVCTTKTLNQKKAKSAAYIGTPASFSVRPMFIGMNIAVIIAGHRVERTASYTSSSEVYSVSPISLTLRQGEKERHTKMSPYVCDAGQRHRGIGAEAEDAPRHPNIYHEPGKRDEDEQQRHREFEQYVYKVAVDGKIHSF